jgi:hypothetical protein
MNQPGLPTTRAIAVVAVFTAAITASNFALSDVPNVKLLDSLVFVAAFAYGFRIGASVAVVSELVWGVISPYGFGGYIIPFLVLGELVYAASGSLAARIWKNDLHAFSTRNLAIGSIMAVCAFLWDFETNIGTALIAFWPNVTLQRILATELLGSVFMVFHELSDFLLGALVVPLVVVYVVRSRSPLIRRSVHAQVEVG